MEQARPSRTKMLQEKAKKECMKERDLRVHDNSHPSALVLHVHLYPHSQLEHFCQEHGLTCTVHGRDYLITWILGGDSYFIGKIFYL